MSLVATAYAGMSVLLVLSGAALIYPAVKGVQTVVYRRAVLALGASAVLFVVGWLVSDLAYHDIVEARVLYRVSAGILTVAAALHLAAVWLFARDFVRFESESISIESTGETTTGFEDERD